MNPRSILPLSHSGPCHSAPCHSGLCARGRALLDLACGLFLVCGLLVVSGCSQEPTAASSKSGPAALSSVDSALHSVQGPAVTPQPSAAPTRAPHPTSPEEKSAAVPSDPVRDDPPPRDVAALKALRPQAADLRRWLTSKEVTPQTKVVMLQRLERLDPVASVGVATRLAVSQGSDRLVRANAVALLARSKDPRAVEALQTLPQNYQRLAAALRRAQ